MAPYTVMVDDNFHYMDEDERWQYGVFATAEEALAACRKIVDESLAHLHKPGMTAEELYQQYVLFGDDPFIVGPDVKGVLFSAWTYARERATAICGHQPAP